MRRRWLIACRVECLDWLRHPCFSPAQLSALLIGCYHKFFSMRHALRNLYSYGGKGMLGELMGNAAMSLFSRHCVRRVQHHAPAFVLHLRWLRPMGMPATTS